ncbi:MAG: EF-hand domain-containing protein [Marinicella sp.]
MPKLSPEEIAEIKDHFDFFDEDSSGLIDIDEFTQLLKILAPEASNDNAIRGFATIDKDRNEQIDFDEFLDWWKMNWTVF